MHRLRAETYASATHELEVASSVYEVEDAAIDPPRAGIGPLAAQLRLDAELRLGGVERRDQGLSGLGW